MAEITKEKIITYENLKKFKENLDKNIGSTSVGSNNNAVVCVGSVEGSNLSGSVFEFIFTREVARDNLVPIVNFSTKDTYYTNMYPLVENKIIYKVNGYGSLYYVLFPKKIGCSYSDNRQCYISVVVFEKE